MEGLRFGLCVGILTNGLWTDLAVRAVSNHRNDGDGDHHRLSSWSPRCTVQSSG